MTNQISIEFFAPHGIAYEYANVFNRALGELETLEKSIARPLSIHNGA